MIVCLDAGHGGKDNGATSFDGKFLEKNLNLEFAERCSSIISMSGYHVEMTREIDEFISISNRCKYANAIKADIFISLHHNSSKSSKAHGCEVLYYPFTSAENIGYAQLLVERICTKWDLLNRGAKEGWYRGDKTKGVLGVLKHTKMPAFIIEPVFLSSSSDMLYITDEQTRKNLYIAVAKSIVEVIRYAIDSQ